MEKKTLFVVLNNVYHVLLRIIYILEAIYARFVKNFLRFQQVLTLNIHPHKFLIA